LKKSLSILTAFYGWLLVFYPRSFRKEFEEEMLLDFRDMLDSASLNGGLALIFVLLRELRDIPINLLQVHMEDGHMLKIFRSQPVNTGLRSAFGFGFPFAITAVISVWISQKLASSDSSIITRLQAYFLDYFHTEQWSELISWLPTAVGSLLTGLVFGVLFAILFTDRTRYLRYIIVGMVGWFLHDAVRSLLAYSFNLTVFLSNWEYLCFDIMMGILSGSFLGLIFIVAKSERWEPVRFLVIGAFAYPLTAYFYMKQMFDLFVFATPWRFVAVIILWVLFLGGIFIIVIKSDGRRKMHWVVIAGAFGYPIMTYISFFGAQLIFPPTSGTGLFDDPLFWLYLVIGNAIFGILIGLLLGVVLGSYKKIDLQQMTT